MRLKNPDKTKQLTRGGQITFHNLRMLMQVNKTIWNMYLPSLVMLIVASVYIITPQEVVWSAWYWCLAKVNPLLELLNYKMSPFKVPYHGSIYNVSPKNFLSYAQFVKNAKAIVPYLKIGIGFGATLSIGVFYAITRWLINAGEKQTVSQYVRGAKLDIPKNVAKMIKERHKASDITIDGMPLVKDSETKHILIHGSTGAGKTQLISKLLDQIRQRGDKVFLYDKGGVYTSIFYEDGRDKILNPFDARSENWDLWHEARSQTDFENLAASLIPSHNEPDPFWINSARTIFGSAAFTMQNDSDRSIKKLLKTLLNLELNDLHNYLSDTDAANLTSDKIEKTATSIRSVITNYLKSLRSLVEIEKSQKPKFCIRDWLYNSKDNGWLFLSSNAAEHLSLIPLISMWFSIATVALLALPENRDRRLWFICDELPSLHQLPRLLESIAEARKFGGCFVLGMQDYLQLEEVYGKNAGQVAFDLMNTSFFFVNPNPTVAEFVSKALGSQEVEDMRENYSYGANTIRDGISIGSQRMINQLVIPSEIMNLDEMKCYLRLPGSYPISLLDLILERRSRIVPDFIKNSAPRDGEIDELISKFDAEVVDLRITKSLNQNNQQSSKKDSQTNSVQRLQSKLKGNMQNEQSVSKTEVEYQKI